MQAEEKSRKNYEKVKHKYDEALHDLKEAEADLNSKIHEREKLAQQHKLAEMKIGEQKHAMEEHDVRSFPIFSCAADPDPPALVAHLDYS